jgi:hypothetical protein
MKVTFKLTAAQRNTAQERLENLNAEWASLDAAQKELKEAKKVADATYWDSPEGEAAKAAYQAAFAAEDNHRMHSYYPREVMGNLHLLEEGCFINPAQSVDLVGGKLVVEGERCPLVQDGALSTIAKIAGYASEKEAHSDEWAKLEVHSYKTSDQRLSWYETLSSYIYRAASLEEMLSYMEKHPGNEAHVGNVVKVRFPEMVRVVNGLISGDRRVHAEFSLEEIIPGRKLARYEHAVYCMNHN